MSDIERLTVTLPAEMAALVKAAVDTGDYASASEVIRDALRDWKMKRLTEAEKLAGMKREVEVGTKDREADAAEDFDVERIVERGRQLLASRTRPD